MWKFAFCKRLCYYKGMMRYLRLCIPILFTVFFIPFFSVSATTTYIPAASIAMTGSNGEVYFDVADDIINSGSIIWSPVFYTTTSSFSWAFYLSWAWWVDFSTGSYSVMLDCGVQSLDALNLPCTLSGVAFSETIGDIFFDRNVVFLPELGTLSGRVSTYIGEYSFSGIALPLMPASFLLGNRVTADHAKNLTLSGIWLYSGLWSWIVHIETIPGSVNVPYSLFGPTDLSHASLYRVDITDPDGGTTIIDDFEVIADVPSSTLSPVSPTIREQYCIDNPVSILCPDGSTRRPATLDKIGNALIANGVDTYDFTLKLRDKYGNMVSTWMIRADYTDNVRTLQVNPFEYGNYIVESCPMGTCALLTSGDLFNSYDGRPTTTSLPVNAGDVVYRIGSIAPTSIADSLSLSGIFYTDIVWGVYDIADISWKSPLSFLPWYSTSISPPSSIVVGENIDFITNYTHISAVPPPIAPRPIYSIFIWANSPASINNFTSESAIFCTKYFLFPGSWECNWMWFGSPDPVIIATEASSFSWMYSYGWYEPPPEELTYTSYIHYRVGANTILYPSWYGSLGTSTPGLVRMKILGQHNLPGISGVQEKNIANIWNTLHKNTALISRNRTDYSDVAYRVITGDVSLSESDFTTSSPEKRTIVSLWGNITITGDISRKNSPISIIALTDRNGNGGDISIDPSVTMIHATLFAQKSVRSSGNNQLAIHGSVISHNSISDTTCPYYVSPCASPELYNLENIRKDYLTSPWLASASLGGNYLTIPLIIEYDGRILSDPPPMLEK